jgi:hypothetical protein
MQPGFGNQIAMQPGFANQFGSVRPNYMPAGRHAICWNATPTNGQSIAGSHDGMMVQQQQGYGNRLGGGGYVQHPAMADAHYYSQGMAPYGGGYPSTNEDV